MVNDDARELRKILASRSYIQGTPFKLASGKTSTFYFECQKTTRHAAAMPLIGRVFLDRIREQGVEPQSVGGLAQGADPIAQAIAHTSLEYGQRIVDSFSVRKEQKKHGTQRWIEGCAPAGAKVVIVDDVITTGGSVVMAIDRCEQEGLSILQVIVLVDREDGGLDTIKKRLPGVPVSAIFTKTQLDETSKNERGNPHAGMAPSR
jgi:orotate phosphoribosyltransferase